MTGNSQGFEAWGEEASRRRHAMVREQLVARGIRDTAVVAAMAKIPREDFVPVALQGRAYLDGPLPLDGATISQPYVVAYMTELAQVRPGDRVLEIGTGSGYQAAVLAEVGAEVYTIEVRPLLAEAAKLRLTSMGYDNIHFRLGNGWDGWPEEAPFDAIIATAAPPSIPRSYAEQLAEGGRLVIPVGPYPHQSLIVATREGDALRERDYGGVAFVPLVQWGE